MASNAANGNPGYVINDIGSPDITKQQTAHEGPLELRSAALPGAATRKELPCLTRLS